MDYGHNELEIYHNELYADDFGMVEINPNGQFVRITEINKMIEYGAIKVDRTRLEEYKFDTRVAYDKEKYTREEAMKLWYGSK